MINSTNLRSECDAANKYVLEKFNITLCIDDVKNLSVIEAARASSSPDASATDSSSTSGSDSAGTSKDSAEKSSSKSKVPIVVGCLAGALAVLGIGGYFCYSKRKESSMKNTATGGATEPSNASSVTATYVPLWSDRNLLCVKVSNDDIEDIRKVGQGAFCDVWLVKFRTSQLLASKRLRESDVTPDRTQAFIEEIKLVKTPKHPNIVQFVGVAWIMEADLQALFEYMEGGDLRSYLVEKSSSPRDWDLEKLQIAIDVTEALVYVHSFLPPLVHRDLKSRNVLLNSEMRAKLTDFGVSRYWSNQNTMTAGVGTGRWLAPEVISGDGSYGTAADLFSFGVLLSELDTHELPYHDVRGANGNQLADVALLQMISTGELKPAMSGGCPEKVALLANRCFSLNPVDRPNATEVAYILRTLKKSLTSIYI